MTTSAQAAARRRFMECYAPMTYIPEVRRTFIDPDLVGRQLYHRGLGVVLAYEYSFSSGIDLDGDTVHAGTVIRVRRGLGITIGGAWAYWANRLSIVVSNAIVPKGESHEHMDKNMRSRRED